MPHAGTYLGGIRTLDDLRQRCVIDEIDDRNACWHFRRADGTKHRPGVVQKVWVHGVGATYVTRAAWLLARGEHVKGQQWRVVRACCSDDCVNPSHLRKTDMHRHQVLLGKAGRASTPAKRAAIHRIGRERAVVTPELLRWLTESPQCGADIAHALGISAGRANALRRRERQRAPSVFAWRPQ